MVPKPQINTFQGSVATVDYAGEVDVSMIVMLCAKYYGNRLTFVETTAK